MKINIKEKIKKHKKIVILIIVIILIFACIIPITNIINRQNQIKEIKDKPLLEYEVTKKVENNKYEILVKINNENGIETVKYTKPYTNKETQLNAHNKIIVGIDYVAEDKKDYEFKIKLVGEDEKTEILHFEIPRIKGNYTLSKGIYVNEPDLTGYNQNYTRYLDITADGNLTPGNWVNGDKPENWYDYKNSQWANIYVENNGLETYYTWIPRYCFKLDQENQRSDVKFIDVYNNYKDKNGVETKWEELEAQGYQVPEAFEFSNTQIPGYWSMKYTAGESDKYTINFETIASKQKVKITNIKKDTTEEIAKYTYAIDGNIIYESTTPEDFEKVESTENEKVVNVTALNSAGEIVGSMTKKCKQAVVNPPELTGFNADITFYVTYDENDNEHSTIPISSDAPEDWYDYGDSKWANIVTRNNGLETYYTWIPRYEFKLDQTAQRSNINFLEGTTTQNSDGYQIPEAFTFDGKQLTGYWAMKYTAGDAAAPRFDTEVMATSASIKTKGITGTAKADGQVYKYYINGEYKGEKTEATESFEYTGLNPKTKYTIQVEIRNSTTDEYIGSIVKQISTIDAYKPELIGFNADCTYYVLYDENGNETIGDKIKNDGSNMPNNWYDYSQSKWANIVVQANGKTTYFTWIPRYEFMITSSQYAQPSIGRTEVRFIEGTSTQTDTGYQIPEAFTFDGKQLTGYWAMKYTAGD